MRWVLELRETIEIPNTLQDIGIDQDRVDEIGPMAVADPSSGTNPIQFSAEQYSRILNNAIVGDL